jgi:phosphoserine phosphatase
VKQIVIFDLDHTIYNGSLGQDFILHLVSKNLISPKIVSELSITFVEYETETISYEETVEKILKYLASQLVGIDFKSIQKEAELFIKTNHHKFYDFVFEIPKIYPEFNYVILSLEPEFLLKEVGKMLNIKNIIGNKFSHNEKFDDKYMISIDKVSLFNKSTFKDFKIFASFGDSESDFKILEKAQFKIMINPTKKLQNLSKDLDFIKFNPTLATEEFKKLVP